MNIKTISITLLILTATQESLAVITKKASHSGTQTAGSTTEYHDTTEGSKVTEYWPPSQGWQIAEYSGTDRDGNTLSEEQARELYRKLYKQYTETPEAERKEIKVSKRTDRDGQVTYTMHHPHFSQVWIDQKGRYAL